MSADTKQTGGDADERSRIEQALESAFAACAPTEVLRAARYATLGGGQRWRGRLSVAAGAIFRADADACVLPLAAALEMMHAASLVLDDLPAMDDAATRRGKACVHLVFPDWAVAMLPAYLVNLAYRAAIDNPRVPEACRIRALLALGDMGERLARGQERDLALVSARVAEADLLECYALKSGALFAAALAGGALLCGADADAAAALRGAGVRLGQAYQLLDDVADGPAEDGAGRFTACALFGPAGARARANALLAEAEEIFARWGGGADRLRALLRQIRA